jgi:hypothetical protein
MDLTPDRLDRPAWLTAVTLTAAALVIRLAWLGRKSFWLDEVFVLQVAARKVGAILSAQADPHPPLYYLGMHYWLALGSSESVARLPSAILGAFCVGLIYLLGRLLWGDWVGRVAAIMLAVAPVHLWYSQEARMYVALCAFTWPGGYSVRRHALVGIPFFLLAVTWALSKLRRRALWASVLVILTLPATFLNLAVIDPEDWRSVATLVQSKSTPQDIVLFSAPYYDLPFNHYYHGPVARAGVLVSDIPDRLERLVRGRPRVWLVQFGEKLTDPAGQIPAWLDARYGASQAFRVSRIRVRLY